MLKPLPCIAYRSKKRRAILSALRLAQELGAEMQNSRSAEEKAVVRYAREHNLGKIILGRPASRRWWRRERLLTDCASPPIDEALVALDEPPRPHD